MSDTVFAGTAPLVGVSLRRDRLLLSIWGLLLVVISYASAAGTESIYPTAADRVSAAEAINASPAIVALYGPILDVTSRGELAMTKMTVLYAVFVAALFVVLVRRHTRSEEESGRTEFLGGTTVGRDAPLAAALLESAVAAVAIGVLTTVANVAAGLPVSGSIAFGASWTGIGLFGAGVSAVACQLSASARTCGAIAASAIGVAYLLRAVGDTSASWLSWLTPFGWGTQLRAYSEVRWWVLVLYAALTIALALGARTLRSHRDLGSGLVPARPGPAVGAGYLAGAVSLAARLHAATLVVWTAAVATMGVVLGAIVPNVSDLLDSASAREMMQRLGGEGAIERSLIAAELSIVAVAVSCFGISVIARGAADEESGRSELVLATATSRTRSFLATLVVAFLGSCWLLLVTGLAVGAGYGGAGSGLGHALGEVVPAALAQTAAAWVVVALAALVFAARARWTFLAWIAVALFVTLGQVGELLRLPERAIKISPYTHTPSMPVASFAWAPELGLALVAAALTGLAWWSYRSRDLA